MIFEHSQAFQSLSIFMNFSMIFEHLGEKLSFGMLVRDSTINHYFRKYFLDNHLQMEACTSLRLNVVTPKKVWYGVLRLHWGEIRNSTMATVRERAKIGGGGSVKSVKGHKGSTKTLKQDDNWQLIAVKGLGEGVKVLMAKGFMFLHVPLSSL